MLRTQTWTQTGPTATDEDVKKNFDKLINYMISNYYDTTVLGETTMAYFTAAKDTRKAMDKVFMNGQMFLPSDPSSNLQNGPT